MAFKLKSKGSYIDPINDMFDPLLKQDETEDESSSEALMRAEGEKAGADVALAELRRIQAEIRSKEGFRKSTFFLGIMNVVGTTFILAAFPAWFWLWYGLKCFLLIPLWGYTVHKVYGGIRFLFDFCWVMNMLFGIYMALNACDRIPAEYRKSAFITFFAVSTGPLAWACLLLHNGIVFHSVEKLVSLFIHMSPTLVIWSVLVWGPDEVQKTWPNVFMTPEEMSQVSFGQIYLHGMCVYSAWIILHGIWLVVWGVDVPRHNSGATTVFHGLYTGKEQFFAKISMSRPSDIRRHAVAYLMIHFAAVCVSFVPPGLMMLAPRYAITAFGAALFINASYSGSSYYSYLVEVKYEKGIKKSVEKLGDEVEKKKAAIKT